MELKKLDVFIDIAGQKPRKKIAGGCGRRRTGASGDCSEKTRDSRASPGREPRKIHKISSNLGFDLSGIEIIEENDPGVQP